MTKQAGFSVQVQHPGLRDSFAADAATVEALVTLFTWFFPGFEYSWLVDEVKHGLPKVRQAVLCTAVAGVWKFGGLGTAARGGRTQPAHRVQCCAVLLETEDLGLKVQLAEEVKRGLPKARPAGLLYCSCLGCAASGRSLRGFGDQILWHSPPPSPGSLLQLACFTNETRACRAMLGGLKLQGSGHLLSGLQLPCIAASCEACLRADEPHCRPS